jgi:hypothetical protein
MRIVQQCLARLAQLGITLFVAAIESYHQLYHPLFFFNAVHSY